MTGREGLRERIEALCDEAEYVVLANDDPGTAPVQAVAVSDLLEALVEDPPAPEPERAERER